MKRIKMLALGAATIALLGVGTACSDPAGTEDWWDEEDQAEFMAEFQKSAPHEAPVEQEYQGPKRKLER
jgi:ABC-type glycerol-3-phosphate transport system substrate-binding protein